MKFYANLRIFEKIFGEFYRIFRKFRKSFIFIKNVFYAGFFLKQDGLPLLGLDRFITSDAAIKASLGQLM